MTLNLILFGYLDARMTRQRGCGLYFWYKCAKQYKIKKLNRICNPRNKLIFNERYGAELYPFYL